MKIKYFLIVLFLLLVGCGTQSPLQQNSNNNDSLRIHLLNEYNRLSYEIAMLQSDYENLLSTYTGNIDDYFDWNSLYQIQQEISGKRMELESISSELDYLGWKL